MSAGVLFRLEPAPTFEATARILVPGSAEPHPLRLVFRHKGKRDLAKWHQDATGRVDAELLAEIVVGWTGVSDASGADVPYTTEALSVMLNAYPAAAENIYDAYMEALQGARRKNW